MTRDVRRSGPFFLMLLLLAGAADAKDRKTLTIRTPKVTLAAGSNVEICYFLRIPTTTPFAMGSWQLVNKGAKGGTQPSHALAYLYTGENLAGFPSGEVVQSRGCLDLGPADRDRRVLFAGSSSPKVVRALPTGVGLELAPVPDTPGGAPAGIGILIDAAWANDEPKPKKVSTTLVLKRVKKGTTGVARPIADRSADAGILVPPFSEHSTAELVDARWTTAKDVCVLGLTSQMHRRGQCAGVDQLDASGQVKEPAVGLPNRCEPDQRKQLFVGNDWTDPGALAFTAPMAMRAGEALRYSCWVDNGGPRGAAVRLGCEESSGVVPGSIGKPAVPCTIALPASAECPGNAACVFANAVAGSTADDEVCGITALVYDAAPGGSCNLTTP
jgi:hypothetical protein